MEQNKDENPFPEFNLRPWSDCFPKLAKCARFIFRMPHQLSEVSDHKFTHPFDHELYDLPPNQVDALNNMNQMVCDIEGRDL